MSADEDSMTASPARCSRVRLPSSRSCSTSAGPVSAVLLFGPAEAYSVLVVDDLSQVAARLRHRQHGSLRRPHPRRPPSRLGRAGRRCAGWLVGQSIWSWYELVLHDGTPFPSVADVGFLGFPRRRHPPRCCSTRPSTGGGTGPPGARRARPSRPRLALGLVEQRPRPGGP
jgi:hypothetical protein